MDRETKEYMDTTHQSFSMVHDVLQGDKEKAKSLLIQCVIDDSKYEEELDRLKRELIKKDKEQESILRTITHVCKLMKIELPINLPHNGDMYMIDMEYNTQIVRGTSFK